MNDLVEMPTLSVIILFVLVLLIILVGNGMMRLRPEDNTLIKTIMYISIIALLFTISSLFWTKDTAYDRATLRHLEFGWPIPFVIQNQDRFDPPFPYAMPFGWALSSNTEGQPVVQVVWKNSFASFAINFFVALIGWFLSSSLLGRKWGMKW